MGVSGVPGVPGVSGVPDVPGENQATLGDFLTLPAPDPEAAGLGPEIAAAAAAREPAEIHGNAFGDANLDGFVAPTTSAGGAAFLARLLRSPSRCPEEIRERQRAVAGSPDEERRARAVRAVFAGANGGGTESAVLWVLRLAREEGEAQHAAPAAMDQWPLNMLFFRSWPLRFLNDSNTALRANHVTQCYLTPASMVAMPAVAVVAPYLYMRFRLGLPLTVSAYLRVMRAVVRRLMQQSDVSWLSIAVWLVFFLGGVVQVVQNARNLDAAHRECVRRAATVNDLIAAVGAPRAYPGGLLGLRRMVRDPAPARAALLAAYRADALAAVRARVSDGTLAPVAVGGETRIAGLGHPALPRDTQVRNPCDLSRGMVVTGPNASGKSTYARAVLCATLMAQAVGHACVAPGARACVVPFATVHSHMRVEDRMGDASLFQTELALCKHVLASAAAARASGRRTAVFMDEPFHSVSPDVGDAIAQAFLRRFADLGATVVVTSHYPGVARAAPGNVVGFQVGAAPEPGAPVVFSYRLSCGRSGESVVLDMIRDETDATVLGYARAALAA